MYVLIGRAYAFFFFGGGGGGGGWGVLCLDALP